MKVLLVNPPASERFPSTSRMQPLGLAYIAGILEKNGFSVNILDASVGELNIEQAVEKIIKSGADVVGFTAMTPNYPQTEKIAKLLKQKKPSLVVVIGGSHATFLPEQALESGFDFVMRGEGEQTFLELCNELNGQKDFRKISGLSFRHAQNSANAQNAKHFGMPENSKFSVHNEKTIHNPDRGFLKNLDELPFPAYHLLDIDAYQNKAPPSNVRSGRWLCYSSSRGCPYNCFYCSVSPFWGKVWRGHSSERIANDLERLKKSYSLKSIFFVDDNFTFRRERIIELCRLMKEKNLNLEWSCSCRVDQVDEELLREMRSAGCWRIGFGVEAGTQKVIDWYGKKITIEKAVQAVKLCRKAGISPFCFFIIGAPIETASDIKETISATKKINPDIVGISFLTPFPGSKLYDYVLENGLLLTKDFYEFSEDVPVIKGNITPEKLKELSMQAYREFYFRPSYILKQVGAIAKNPKLALRGFKTILSWTKQKK